MSPMKTSSPFLNEVIAAIRFWHYSIRTEQAWLLPYRMRFLRPSNFTIAWTMMS